ncbi:MAG: chromate transporter [Clostridia bacterium]|nr:chromate transporter [Clostridia bacterium]
MNKAKKILKLFLAFLKIGGFTFGGGYAMIPLIQKEAVEKQGWVTDEDILEILAIAESTPGPIAINSATFIGYKTAGVLGSAAATFGVVLPSFVIISIIARVLTEFSHIDVVRYAFLGIRAGVIGLVIKAVYTMFRKVKKNAMAYVVMLLAFVCVAIFDIHVLIVIASCAVIGLIYSLTLGRKEQGV